MVVDMPALFGLAVEEQLPALLLLLLAQGVVLGLNGDREKGDHKKGEYPAMMGHVVALGNYFFMERM
jgi:hypothetical protein